MAKLIVLNGPCGVGKSTIAGLYAEREPLTLVLDIDEVRRMIGGYRENKVESRLQSLKLAFAMCAAHLESGKDVIIPNIIRAVTDLVSFEIIAKSQHADYYELLLSLPKEAAVERATERGFRPGSLLTSDKLEPMYEELMEVVAKRPRTLVVDASGEVDVTFERFAAHLNPSP